MILCKVLVVLWCFDEVDGWMVDLVHEFGFGMFGKWNRGVVVGNLKSLVGMNLDCI